MNESNRAPVGTPEQTAFHFDNPPLLPLTTAYSTDAPTNVPTSDPRITDLAATLNNDVDRIYEFVRNTIETTPAYGLSKGAFGAMIDGAGTPFDQADLMVRLVRAAGGTADYVTGNITVDGATFTSWFGPTTNRGACELLAAGGIPATVGGGSGTDCSAYNTDPVGSVTFAHAWVQASVGGVNYQFDPSFKRSNWFEADPAITGALTSLPTSWEDAGGASGFSGQNNDVAHMNGYTVGERNDFRGDLSGIASAMFSGLAATENNGGYEGRTSTSPSPITPSFAGASAVPVHVPQSMAEASGGFELVAEPMYHSSHYPREDDHPFRADGASATTHTTLPSSMRTYVRFFLTTGIQGVPDANSGPVDASILAGRRIAATRGMVVTADETTTIAQPSSALSGVPTWAVVNALVVIDHPYGGTSGTYADTTYRWQLSNGMPTYFGLAFGSRGNGAEMRNTAVVSHSGAAGVVYPTPCSQSMAGDDGGVRHFGGASVTPINPASLTCQSTGIATFCPIPGESGEQFRDRATYVSQLIYQLTPRTYSIPQDLYICNEGVDAQQGWGNHPERQGHKLAALEGFMTHASRLLDVYEGLANGRRVQHHLVGVASLNLSYHPRGYISSDSLAIDFGGRFGFASRSEGARSRRSFAFASSYALAALERQVVQVQSDAVSVNGVASMFDWFIASDDGANQEISYFDGFAQSAQIRFFNIEDSYDRGEIDSLLLQGGDPYDRQGRFLADGYDLVLPQSLRLGPARLTQRLASQFPTTFSGQQLQPSQSPYTGDDDYLIRAQAFIAYREAASGISIAPLAAIPCQQATGCFSGLNKGAGGGNFPSSIEAPVAGREELDERYESWATSFNVDMRTGGLTLTPPPDLTDGAGDYPYSLAFQRSYSSDRGAAGPLGWGWTHNFDISLTTGTDIGAALGEQSWTHAAATLTVAETMLELFDSGSSTVLRDSVTAQMALAWWSDLVFDNRASIQRGAAQEKFYWGPNASGAGYHPEPGSNATLSRSGSRQVWYHATTPDNQQATQYPGYYRASVNEAFDRRNWSFSYTSGSGVTESYIYRVDYTQGDYEPSDFEISPDPQGGNQYFIGSVNRFRPVSTVFPFGITVHYDYDATSSNLTSIRAVQTASPNTQFSEIALHYNTNPNAGYQPDRPSYPSSIGYGPRDRLAWILADDRRVDFNYADAPAQSSQLSGVENTMNEETTYSYADIAVHSSGASCDELGAAPLPFQCTIGARLRLADLQLPHAPTTDFLSFTYDSEAQTRSVITLRSTSYFDPGNGSRSSSRDGVGWRSYSYYDRDGRQIAHVDAGNGVTETDYDGRGRTFRTRTGYSWQPVLQRYQRSETWYNARNNPVLQRQRTNTDAVGDEASNDTIDAVSEYGYSSFPDLVTRTLDPNGNATRYCYHSGQTVAGQSCSGVQAANDDGLLRGTFGPSGEETLIEYDNAGRVTRQRVRAD